ncbi:30S ribosomal protein S13 [Candidatus Adlerbacteria bacterium RIFCSPHIGHO2_01_FULL_54_23]|uniref:Small ribosomal subunit protein uS13 n=3 Tax=Candidatus Adleribacteriota TaxID=1752736 RepID=A0A1F4Y2R8_9BACT|nr:MAG: 30S ribosomal protein S13 [Candidatus Adlerbacteria bacterium GW2011_GWA1_54_10]KKW37977.1 MAG: 30S ribosomal protein S13 [Candidatus Adlerbacteria bacterium GW2011_GWB1_54_7]OGC78584.1 MAG: 30S ribosomal protein S13 [Candidatus Adlerbacteria bacterium RIFCSPHIGHO2_01_FULL_54_23]OGC87593.1 MAG: 30S ribosomal protein S13 [Candidatus Adlerbacteria bacterium RIFCSPLOWO2_01_FULL_54_16]
MRIAGITIPNKRLPYALATLYGIGIPLGRTVCLRAGVDFNKKAGELSAAEEQAIRKELETIKMEGDLRRETAGNIKRLRDIGAYRGSRHTKRLPVRGQRTKTNSRTVRGNVRKTMGSGRRKVEKT